MSIALALPDITFLEMIVKGTIIGVVASAPMGPVGILCVQRTLNKGRWAGFATGVGAAFSDIIYALITGYGMSMVVSIIENPKWAFWIKLVGCLLLFLFGFYTYKTNPEKAAHMAEHQAKKAGKSYKSAKKNAPKNTLDMIQEEKRKLKPMKLSRVALMNHTMTGFLVTFSNPLIIFLFVALFGQFTFIQPFDPGPQIMGYLFIVVGAVGWWFGLTWLIDKVRNRFDVHGIWVINRIIGVVVMAVSAIIAFCTFF